MSPRVLTVSEVAEALHCSTSTVYRLIDARRLRAVRIGNGTRRPGLRITEAALDDLLADEEAQP